jgi:hypothetical protein
MAANDQQMEDPVAANRAATEALEAGFTELMDVLHQLQEQRLELLDVRYPQVEQLNAQIAQLNAQMDAQQIAALNGEIAVLDGEIAAIEDINNHLSAHLNALWQCPGVQQGGKRHRSRTRRHKRVGRTSLKGEGRHHRKRHH